MALDLLKTGAAYVRVSDERQDEYSPDSQLKKIREYAKKEGYHIPDRYVFYDDGISGKSVKRREDFKRMIGQALDKSRPFERIYVWKFSRFARNQEDSIIAKNALHAKGITVVSVSEPIPEGPFGDLIERIIEWTDQYYLENLSTEVMRGMTEKASRGEPVCAPPFGYLMKDGKYYPDEESGNADVIREIFTRFASGMSIREIAVMLGERGVRTKRGNMPENRWIEYILRNHCYIGKIRWSTDGSKAVSKRQLDNQNIMITNGQHEALVSAELWNQVQNMLDEQKKAYPKYARKNQSVKYMLKGLIRCSDCGGAITLSSTVSGKAKVLTLQCCNYQRGSCNISHSVTLPRLEEAFIRGLDQALGDMRFTIAPKLTKIPSVDFVDYDKLIETSERQLERAKAAYLAGIDTIEQYAMLKNEIMGRIDYLKEQKESDNNGRSNITHFSKKVFGIVEFLKRTDITPMAKNQALRTIISKVIYDKTNNNLAIYLKVM